MEIGDIDFWTTEIIPSGYLIANGSAVSRSTYASLFSVIGVRYGVGDGSTTFNLPDVRGYFPRFQDLGAGRDPDRTTVGVSRPDGSTKTDVGSKEADALESHEHYSPAGNSGIGNMSYLLGGAFERNSNYTGGDENRPKNMYFVGVIRHS